MLNESCVEMVVRRGLSLFFADESNANDEALRERLSALVAPSVCPLRVEGDVGMSVDSSLACQGTFCRALALFECLSLFCSLLSPSQPPAGGNGVCGWCCG